MMHAKARSGSLKFRLADWGRKQRSGSRSADHLLMHLTALCNTTHRCTLSDSGIAKYFDLKKRSVSRHLGILRAQGLIKVHFAGTGYTKRVITFCFSTNRSHSGVAPAPEWRSDQRQDGRQNPKVIESGERGALSQAPSPIPFIHPNASPVEAMLAYRQAPQRTDDGGG
jgi:DNA-binding transcriptional ArsR family regulator